MPFINIDGARLYYRLEGSEAKPVLMLSHSLGCDHGMWDPQMPAWLERFRILRYDTRGHGASDVTPGEYSIAQLARDATALADGLRIAGFAFCGLSLGGMTGQWIAANTPGRITRLVLANTSAKFPDPSIMEARIQTVRASGMSAIADSVMRRFFTNETLDSGNPHAATTRAVLLATDPAGYAGCCAAVRDLDNRELLSKIHCPTLIIAGEHDQSTPYAGHGELLAARIAGAKVVHYPTAHISNIERPREFTSAVSDFLA
jgi:3-oxoadipate enol-lactonase